MKEIFYQAVNLLPGVTITIVVAYFYARKKTPGLLLLLIAYALLTVITAASFYLPQYVSDRAMTTEALQRLYTIIGITSLLVQVLLAVALAIVLSRYPDKKKTPL